MAFELVGYIFQLFIDKVELTGLPLISYSRNVHLRHISGSFVDLYNITGRHEYLYLFIVEFRFYVYTSFVQHYFKFRIGFMRLYVEFSSQYFDCGIVAYNGKRMFRILGYLYVRFAKQMNFSVVGKVVCFIKKGTCGFEVDLCRVGKYHHL